jgi:carbonic anhydrase
MFMHPSKNSWLLLTAAAASVFPCVAGAADWLAVASEAGERVEIDLARIERVADGKTLAWDRLLLGHEVRSGDHGIYDAVEALNRYDCARKRFATVKRVYWHGERRVAEETIPSPREMGVVTGAVDDRLLAQACRPRSVGEMQQVAEAAGRAATGKIGEAVEQPKVMHADMRAAAEPTPVGGGGAAAAPTPATGEKSAEPLLPKRLIELPKIDKSQVELPKSESTAKPTAKANTVTRGSREREQQYATSGPRKKVVKKRLTEARAAPAPVVASAVPWSYSGAGGPSNWGKLRPEFALCGSGKRQSPIDIRDSIHVDLAPISFEFRETHFRILDTGHTIQVSVGEGNSITVMGQQYLLKEIIFHHPAEERIDGRGFDMDMQLIHRDAENRVAIVSVLIEKGPEHPVIQTFWNNLPLETDHELAPREAIDLNKLLPENRAYMAYMGSSTTPPCSEEVLWLVFRTPITISPEQLDIFSRLYPNNARPLQPANGRLIKESR